MSLFETYSGRMPVYKTMAFLGLTQFYDNASPGHDRSFVTYSGQRLEPFPVLLRTRYGCRQLNAADGSYRPYNLRLCKPFAVRRLRVKMMG